MNNLDDFIKSLNLPFEGKMQGSEYIIRLNTSDDFSEVYNIVSNNNDLNIDNNSLSTEDKARFIFTDGDFEVRCSADFKEDQYKIIISRR